MDARAHRARVRLGRDAAELERRAAEFPTLSAVALEEDLFEWHANIVGPEYEGTQLDLPVIGRYKGKCVGLHLCRGSSTFGENV